MSSHSLTPAPDVTTLAPLLSINEVAAILGVSRASVYTLMSAGKLTPIRIGERARFDPADVRDYIEQHRESSP